MTVHGVPLIGSSCCFEGPDKGPNPYPNRTTCHWGSGPADPRSELRKRRFEAVESAATEVAEGGNIMGGNWAMIIVMVRDVVEKSAQNDRID